MPFPVYYFSAALSLIVIPWRYLQSPDSLCSEWPDMTSLTTACHMPLLLSQTVVGLQSQCPFTSLYQDWWSRRRCVGDWRQLYELGQDALQEKAAGLGKRLRAMTQAEVQARQTRSVEVRSTRDSNSSHRTCLMCSETCFACLHMLLLS